MTATSGRRRAPYRNASGPVRWLITHPWVPLITVGLVLFVVWVIGTRSVAHQVKAVFATAPDLYSGEDVQVDGIDAGKVTAITYDHGKAIVGVGINESQYWPLHQGTTVTLRYGTTVGNGTRYLQLDPGPASAPAIPSGGTIPESDTRPAVEFDQVFGIFNPSTRQSFRQALAGTGSTFAPRAKQIGAGVDATGPALSSFGGLTGELAGDAQNLKSLVASGATVTSMLAARQSQISDLVDNAAGTFHAFASNTGGITGSLQRAPGTFVQTRDTLSRVDGTLGHLTTLVTAVRPGAQRLGRLSQNLRTAMRDLRTTVPVADETFAVANRQAPKITRLLKTAHPFASPASTALGSLAPMVACIRPYAPEIAGLLSTWASFTEDNDSLAHLGRLLPQGGATSLTTSPETPAQLLSLYPGTTYSLVKPPGYAAGQSEFIPSCDYTQNYLNASDDPEGSTP